MSDENCARQRENHLRYPLKALLDQMRYNVAFAAALCSMTLLLASGAPWPRKRETVWPLLLEERSAGEELIVMVTRDIVLRLQRASPLAKNVRVVRMFDVANLTSHPEDIQIESREVYEHAESSTVLLITTEKGLRIKGVINNNIRVSYDDNQEIKNGEPVPHFLDIIHHLVGSATWVNDASGSQANVLPLSMFRKLKTTTLMPSSAVLRSYGGNTIKHIGKFSALIGIGGRKACAEFFVVKKDHSTTLGLDNSEKLTAGC
nr:uncharacterized protein LOC119165126 [Rhipicephalus microplus]